ncbi:DUF2239 family protein [Phenylobacterium sp.]|jgi:hypothetical protein|uniref:DUF2239 family protein n=1 Tax=Phenylobacterium sp. TaxID=1871053 RepID=UPI002E308401|nr:DUF2239 family protein [Phenylobacterium sp.]HEX3365002.1 DUF2239 family protein [Phenylobacterium sp.]
MTTTQIPQTGMTAFANAQRIARGEIAAVARAAHACRDEPLLIFEDATGRTVELDLRGSVEDVLARLTPATASSKPARGRPRLGVTAREVTLLPRHWEWLAHQPGGASATLRRLVDQARRDTGEADVVRRAQESTYRVMTVLAGDLPGYEEATRALFGGDQARFADLTASWPRDIGDYVRSLNAKAMPMGSPHVQ